MKPRSAFLLRSHEILSDFEKLLERTIYVICIIIINIIIVVVVVIIMITVIIVIIIITFMHL